MDRVAAFEEAGREVIADRVKILEKAGAKLPRIARELSLIAFSDLGDYLNVSEGGEIQAIPFSEISPRKRRVLKKIKEHTQIKESADGQSIFKDSRIEYELYDKMDALKYLCKLRGDEPAQRQEHSGINGTPLFPVTEEERAVIDAFKEKLLLDSK